MICAACHNEGGQTQNGMCEFCFGSGRMTTGQAVDYETRVNWPAVLVWGGLPLSVAVLLVWYYVAN